MNVPTEPERMQGGWQTKVERIRDVIHRSASPWSASVVHFLSHLDDVGFRASPRPVDGGFDKEGREQLTFMHGESPHPYPWSLDAMATLGGLLRDLHDLADSYRPPGQAVWKNWFGRDLGDSSLGFGHGDLGQWNIMATNAVPTGFIDWDSAGPVDPAWEVAQAGWLNAHLFDDDLADKLELGTAADRGQQLASFLDGYGLDRPGRAGLVDRMAEFAIHAAREEAVEFAVTDESTAAVAESGYPILWGITWRARSASWILRNRSALERAIGT